LCAAVAKRSTLTYLKKVAEFPGFASALQRTLLDLRLARVSTGKLQECGRTGRDLSTLLTAYERQLEELSAADYSSLVDLATLACSTETSYGLITLDLEVRTMAESQLLATLIQHATEHLALPLEFPVSDPHDCLSAVQHFALSGLPAPQRESDDSFRYFSASNESQEFVEIAREILQGSTPLDQTAILLRDARRQEPLVREVFDRAGIPCWYSRGTRRPDLSGRAFLTLLRFAAERYSAKRFCEYLSLRRGPVQFSIRWERLIREAAVIHGLERWQRRLAFHAEVLAERGDSASNDLNALNELQDFVLPIIHSLDSLPKSKTWKIWFDALSSLAEQTLGVPEPILEALEELAPLGDIGPVELNGVLALLEATIPDRVSSEPGSRYGKVFVGSIEEARGLKFQNVFLPGMNEGAFPRPPHEDSLLLDEQRRTLGMHLDQQDGDLLRIAVGAATKKIVFSNSRIDVATGRARVASSFVAEALLAARGAGADLRSLLEQAKFEQSRIGGSAPNDPTLCIDDVEYDLALYRHAFVSKQRGAYAWIGALNSHTKRAIEARTRRWDKPWGYWDGVMATELFGEPLLAGYSPKERAYSVSALQLFSRCPYLFYLSAVAKLSPLRDPEATDRMSPQSRGRIFHRVLYKTRATPTTETLISELSDAALAEAELCAPPVLAFWQADVEKLRADLMGWLATRQPGWTPLYVELAFGLKDLSDRDQSSVTTPVAIAGDFRVSGSMDLVERHTDGRLRVVDHKTGAFPYKLKNLVIDGGEILQPVIYAEALERLTSETVTEALLSFSTIKGGYRTLQIPITEESKRRATKVLELADDMVSRAFLPAAPRGDACKNCEYISVCGPYEAQRLKQKDATEIQALTELRRLS
jgi:RecB family exonuclease